MSNNYTLFEYICITSMYKLVMITGGGRHMGGGGTVRMGNLFLFIITDIMVECIGITCRYYIYVCCYMVFNPLVCASESDMGEGRIKCNYRTLFI